MSRRDAFESALAAWRATPHEEQIVRMAERAGVPRFPSPDPDGGKLRVGLWSPVLFEAGAEAWMLAMARSLADRVSWRGLAVESPRSVDPAISARFAPFMPVASGRDACRSLAGQCDVVVSWAMPDLPGLLAGLQGPPKVVNVCHSPIDSEWGMASYRDPAGIDAYVAVSELALGPICESRRAGARVIWNAVDAARMVVSRDRATMRKLWGVPEGAKVAGYLGRLAHEKDPSAMVRLARSASPDWHSVLVGAGTLRAEVESLARTLGVADRVHLVGPDHAAGDVLNAFDVLVVPSRYESFCLTLAEGLWAGVPVVATRVGIARLRSGLVRPLPDEPMGEFLSVAARVAHEQGPIPGSQAWAREHLSIDRFAREWSEFLHSLAVPRAVKLARVASCPARGPELPASAYEPGCCSAGTLHECRSGKGGTPGRVSTTDCLICVSDQFVARNDKAKHVAGKE